MLGDKAKPVAQAELLVRIQNANEQSTVSALLIELNSLPDAELLGLFDVVDNPKSASTLLLPWRNFVRRDGELEMWLRILDRMCRSGCVLPEAGLLRNTKDLSKHHNAPVCKLASGLTEKWER